MYLLTILWPLKFSLGLENCGTQESKLHFVFGLNSSLVLIFSTTVITEKLGCYRKTEFDYLQILLDVYLI